MHGMQACAALEAMTFALLRDLQDSPPPSAANLAADSGSDPAVSRSRSTHRTPSSASYSDAGDGGGASAGVGDGDSAAAPRSPPAIAPPGRAGTILTR